jgi:hypothetical protein
VPRARLVAGMIGIKSLQLLGHSAGSTCPAACCQAFQPPFKARTFLYPCSISFCAARALVASLGQAQ